MSMQANYVENITADWAAGGINHEMPKAEGWEPVLKIVANGYGRLGVTDDQDNLLVSFASDSPDSVILAANWVADFFNAAARDV